MIKNSNKILFILFFLPFWSFGQLDNSPFYTNDSLNGKPNDVYLHVKSLGFNRNDEYYSRFANGQTHFGYQFNPEIEYYFSDKITLTTGLFVQKDFGNNQYTVLQPTYRLKLKHKNNLFIFGNIRSHLNHKYIEPLMDFEQFYFRPLENGLQYLIYRKSFEADLWLDWEKMIYPNSPFLEEITGGMTTNTTLFQNEKIKLKMPLQWLVYHEGGQLDTTNSEISLISNGALGFTLEYLTKSKLIDKITLDNYLTYYSKHFGIDKFQLKQGNGIYLNATFQKKHQMVMFSYWQGYNYFSMHGGPIYLSQSRSFKNNGDIEAQRKLLFIRIISNFKLSEDVNLSMRLEPFYDFNRSWKETWTNGMIDFSNGLYIQLEKRFFVTNLKDRKIE